MLIKRLLLENYPVLGVIFILKVIILILALTGLGENAWNHYINYILTENTRLINIQKEEAHIDKIVDRYLKTKLGERPSR